MLLLISMPSCTPEEDTLVEAGKGVIQMSLNRVQLRAGDLYADEALIQKVRILVFKENGDIEKNQLFTSGEDTFTNPFRLEISTGTKEVYVIANETSGIGASLSAINTQAALNSMLTEAINTKLTLPLLMVGKVSSIAIAAKQLYTQDITLERVAAKIILKFKKETEAEVSITGVALEKNTTRSLLIAAGIVPNQSYWNYILPIENQINLNTIAQSVSGSEVIYVYDNLTGGDKTNATKLVVAALYNGVPTTYHVYLNENVTAMITSGDPSSSIVSPSDHLYSLKRNYAYELTGTIKDIGEFDGLTLETTVLPWEKVSSTILFDWVFKIAPHPTVENSTYLVYQDGISFTFKLTNPIMASWTANLSNPEDFEIVNYQGATGQEVMITIRPKKAPSAVERTTEFYINTQYGATSVEIPLIQGSALIGPDNRVVIKQPAN